MRVLNDDLVRWFSQITLLFHRSNRTRDNIVAVSRNKLKYNRKRAAPPTSTRSVRKISKRYLNRRRHFNSETRL